MAEDRKTRVKVVEQAQYDGGPFDFGASYENGSLNRVIDSLQAIRDLIPEEYRADARCDIDSEGGYEGSHYANIEVTYDRPETVEEAAERAAKERGRIEEQEGRQRAAYEQLKAKFG